MKAVQINSKYPQKFSILWLLLLPPLANILFMHYYFFFSGLVEMRFMYSIVVNILGVVFDVFMLLFLNTLLCRGKLKCAFVFTQIITMIWAFVNVFYARFFFQYLPLSAVFSAGGLFDSTTIAAMMDGFEFYDLFFLVNSIVFFYLYRFVKPVHINLRQSLRLLLIPVISTTLTILVLSLYYFVQPRYRHNLPLFWIHLKGALYDVTCNSIPNLLHFQAGSIRVLLYESYDFLFPRILSDEERLAISNFITPLEQRTTNHVRPHNVKNVIVILLESMLSHPIDLSVDGLEVTPFLNSLKADSTIYYNGSVKSDITCGESGDGQFIVMNGLLPLRYKTTTGSVKDNTLMALPRLLERQMGISKSSIIIPTRPNMWEQNSMNDVYGIKQMYTEKDIQMAEQVSVLNDSHIFKFAASKLVSDEEPFFHLILSLSTHSPYGHYVGEKLFHANQKLSEEYSNYLCTCHFLDEQLFRYFDSLKTKGLYDNSLIVITADHFAHINRLNMDGQIMPYTPLFIIGGNINRSMAWQGECHQLDIFTTLVDILNLGDTWRGLGHTLLSPNYVNSVDTRTYDISELIINGDYFAP